MSWLRNAVHRAGEAGGGGISLTTCTVRTSLDTVVHHVGQAVVGGARLINGIPGPQAGLAPWNMYQEMLEWIGRPAKGVPQQPIPPLKVSISKKLRAIVEDKYSRAGVEKGKYIVVHGIESDSVANMTSNDCLLPLVQWAEIAKEISSRGNGLRPLFVMSHEKHREEIEDIVGKETSYLFITTPGQLTRLINDSAGVVATNTADVQVVKQISCLSHPPLLICPIVMDLTGFTEQGFKWKLVVQALFGKIMYLSEVARLQAHRRRSWSAAIEREGRRRFSEQSSS